MLQPRATMRRQQLVKAKKRTALIDRVCVWMYRLKLKITAPRSVDASMFTFNQILWCVLLIDRACVWMQWLKLKITDQNPGLFTSLSFVISIPEPLIDKEHRVRTHLNPEIVQELVLHRISARIPEEHLVHATGTPSWTNPNLEEVQLSLRQPVDSRSQSQRHDQSTASNLRQMCCRKNNTTRRCVLISHRSNS